MDIRLQTFLVLCQEMNYRRTAQLLHLTQPAVTKQIQSLEQEFGIKLFRYDGRRLAQTEACGILERYASSLRYNYQSLTQALRGAEKTHLRIGATKTVGDYVIQGLIEEYLSHPRHALSLTVDNTGRLLGLLDDNQLDFAVVEGFFDRRKYGYHLFRREEFVGVCPAGHPFAGRRISLEELFSQTILIREQGSGTRNIFEKELAEQGYSLDAFARVVDVSSFPVIKGLILNGFGVTFAYRAIIRGDGRFAAFSIHGEPSLHEFNFVYLKDTAACGYARDFYPGDGAEEAGGGRQG